MRPFSQTSTSLLSLLLAAQFNIKSTQAWPLGELDFSFLTERTTCVSYCGTESQFCCTQGQSCTTLSGNIATCVAGGGNAAATNAPAGSGYAVYTTTWTETGLLVHTGTVSSYMQAASPAPSSPAGAAPICQTNLGETSCGSVCCPSDHTCGGAGTCVLRTTWAYNAPTDYSAPLRPTSGGVSASTAKVSATTTQPFVPPATASGGTIPVIPENNKKGLSPGAIAGIVIGTIAGVIILLLICFCCILKAGFDGLLAIFGLGKRRRRDTERVEVIEERYSRHSGGTGSRRQTHGGWFGGRPSRVDESRKKKSGFGGFGALGAGLVGLAVILGLKKRHDREKSARSEVNSSYYSYDSYTGSSPSSASSDRRTRESRRSRSRR